MSFVLPVPLLGRINAGMPADSPEVREGEVYVTGKLVDRADQKRLFALRVHGESMRELGIYDEDVVVVNPGAEARPGDIVVALVNNETTVKSYFPLKGGRIELRPANAEFSTQVYPANQVQLQGRVIALQREY
ncbi:LexA repressor [bioreactor metagenome]|uniref:LexA repressor n=1 Tax=bioreactor metagenome TaxID=1076179 RepID=A0A645I7M2_9ZZZZ